MVVSRLVAAVLSLGLIAQAASAQDDSKKKKYKPTDFQILSNAVKKGGVTKADFDMLSEKGQKRYLTLQADSIKVVKLSEEESKKLEPKSQIGLPKPPTGKPFPGAGTPGTGSGTDPVREIDRIINIGKKIWEIIKENKPVVDVKTDYATAVPDGITHWSQLETWKMPKTVAYRLVAKNGYGFNAVDVTFLVTRTWGGSYKGKGQFLHGVAVEPLKRDVSWGYTLNMHAKVPSTVNAGTAEDPIAAMSLVLDWTIKTVLKESGGRGVYYVRGDGQFNDIGARASLGASGLNDKVKKAVKPLKVSAAFD